jgi:hypothetical protein
LSFLRPILAEALPVLHHLRRISLAGLGSAPYIMRPVSSLADLAHLDLNFEDTTEEMPSFSPGDFPSLKSLELSVPVQMRTSIIASLQGVTPLALEKLCLSMSDTFYEDVFRVLELTQSIQDLLSGKLRELEISAAEPFHPDILDPLFECRRIEVLDIPLASAPKGHEADLIATAHLAWSDLCDLAFGFDEDEEEWSGSELSSSGEST